MEVCSKARSCCTQLGNNDTHGLWCRGGDCSCRRAGGARHECSRGRFLSYKNRHPRWRDARRRTRRQQERRWQQALLGMLPTRVVAAPDLVQLLEELKLMTAQLQVGDTSQQRELSLRRQHDVCAGRRDADRKWCSAHDRIAGACEPRARHRAGGRAPRTGDYGWQVAASHGSDLQWQNQRASHGGVAAAAAGTVAQECRGAGSNGELRCGADHALAAMAQSGSRALMLGATVRMAAAPSCEVRRQVKRDGQDGSRALMRGATAGQRRPRGVSASRRAMSYAEVARRRVGRYLPCDTTTATAAGGGCASRCAAHNAEVTRLRVDLLPTSRCTNCYCRRWVRLAARCERC